MHTLEARNISKFYDTAEGVIHVLKDLNFYADKDEFVSFVGPSGCGKSSLFNIITGLLEPDMGSILVDGVVNTGRTNDKMGYVLQKDLLFPWRTVIDNIVLGLECRGTDKGAAREKAHALLKKYGMDGYESKYPASISGGMRQRVALMRTMITDPEVILMDEAYKALDYPLKISLETELLEMLREERKTIVFITHDIEEAVTLSDRVYVMKARPGQIVKEIKVDLATDSAHIPTRRLSANFNEYYELIWKTIANPAHHGNSVEPA